MRLLSGGSHSDAANRFSKKLLVMPVEKQHHFSHAICSMVTGNLFTPKKSMYTDRGLSTA